MPRPANPTLRDDILTAALRLVEKKGPDGLTMRGVAGALGYSATSIYQHFASKEDLLLSLKLQAGAMLAAEMEQAKHEASLEAQLREMGRSYIQFGLENPAYYRLFFQDTTVQDLVTPKDLTRMRQSWAIMRDTLRDWLHTVGFDDIEVDEEANVLWTIVHGITSLALGQRLLYERHEQIFALYERTIDRWFHGILRAG